MQKYQLIETIGSGAHGSVLKMQIKESGSIVAVKKGFVFFFFQHFTFSFIFQNKQK